MTTTVSVHVNGRYRARVVQKNADGKVVQDVVVEGNYDGSPNPDGRTHFHLHHPATGTFEVTETAVEEKQP